MTSTKGPRLPLQSLHCQTPGGSTHLRRRLAVGCRHGRRPRVGAAALPIVLPLLLAAAAPAPPAAVAAARGQRSLRFGSSLLEAQGKHDICERAGHSCTPSC